MKLAPEFLHYALLNVRRLAETSLQIPGICGVRDNYLYATVKGSPQRRERRGPGRSGRDVPTLAGIQRAQGYPVPAPKSSGLTPREAYGYATDLWDPECEYGAARLRLLDWLIAETSPKREV